MRMELKAELLEYCANAIKARRQIISEAFLNAQSAANEETKSSAGDKYETGRAMMHLEKEKLATQMAEVSKMEMALSQIDPAKHSQTIAIGSLVSSINGNYFLAVSLGQIELSNGKYFAISPASPIGRAMLGKKQNDFYEFGGKKVKIEKVL
ncbi:MAG: transcription elongation GreA/GreB family factor [Roseivirga sp.]|jgi:transcription elongation GreA/GreB family factor